MVLFLRFLTGLLQHQSNVPFVSLKTIGKCYFFKIQHSNSNQVTSKTSSQKLEIKFNQNNLEFRALIKDHI